MSDDADTIQLIITDLQTTTVVIDGEPGPPGPPGPAGEDGVGSGGTVSFSGNIDGGRSDSDYTSIDGVEGGGA